jgi:hypothetical protein
MSKRRTPGNREDVEKGGTVRNQARGNEPAGAVFTIEHATVYRAGGRRWFTEKAAIKAYASAKWRTKHPCECEQGDYASGYPGYTCPTHDARDAVLPRYIKLLRSALQKGIK